ncbi:MAG: hypothetical protein SGBAC_011162 [Bacillariaceae sp.]
MEDNGPPSTSPPEKKARDESPKVPSTVNVPAKQRRFTGSEENFEKIGSSSGISSDQSSEEKKKSAAADYQASTTTSLTDSGSSSEIPKGESRQKRRRIEYLSTAKGLKTTNEKLVEENESLRLAIRAIKEQKDKSK